jgi:SAM-dependent methyltransferase
MRPTRKPPETRMISTCRLCGCDDLILWMRDGHNVDLDYYKCGNCALWNYDLDCGLDQNQYTETYVSPEDPEHAFNQHISASWNFLRKHAGTPGSIMDIGCGSAGLLYLARNEGWQVRGMELTEQTSQAIAEDTGIDVIVANFLEYDNPENEKYDVVVLRHVLEHLPDSILAMNKIGKLLKDNGLALLEFPNTRSMSYMTKRILKNRGMRNKKYSSDWRPGHCNEFCRESFEYLLDQTGFELVVWHTYSNKPLANAFYRVFKIASKARVLVRKKPTS